ncbi:MAG: tyrosine-type recombinase/integrase [Phycisphaerales bacterium]
MKQSAETTKVLTDNHVRSLPLAAPGGRYIERDARQPGFFVMVGETTKTYYVQYDYHDRQRLRKTCRKKLGRCDSMTTVEARTKAAAMIAAKDQPQQRKADVTLGAAWAAYETYLRDKGRSPRTIAGGQDIVTRLLGHWQDVPLILLAENPDDVEERYERIKRKHGVASARAAMACLRAVYNRAARKLPALRVAGNPVSFTLETPKPRGDKALSSEELPAWYAQATRLPNPVRQAYHLFALLSSMRRTALAEAQWSHLDVKRRILHVPQPKGGTARAFDLPLSRRLLWVLAKARRAGRLLSPGSPWIFPSVDHRPKAHAASGHLEECKEKSGLATGHALRHTWAAMARLAGCSDYAAHRIMNHKMSGVHDNYGSRDAAVWPLLVAEQEKVSAFIWKVLTAS